MKPQAKQHIQPTQPVSLFMCPPKSNNISPRAAAKSIRLPTSHLLTGPVSQTIDHPVSTLQAEFSTANRIFLHGNPISKET